MRARPLNYQIKASKFHFKIYILWQYTLLYYILYYTDPCKIGLPVWCNRIINESKRFALTIKNLEKFIMQMSDLLLSVKLLFQFHIESLLYPQNCRHIQPPWLEDGGKKY